MPTRSTAIFAVLVAALLAGGTAHGATYAVLVRWTPSASPGVTGYRIALRARTGGSPPVVDAGLPSPAADGSLAAQVSGLDGRTDYDVTVTAYASGGAESVPSNTITIGYVQVAARIDTDGDGLSDAAEDPNLNRAVDPGETSALSADTDGDHVGDAADRCQGTAAGAAVDASGCSCAQVACDGSAATIWPSTAVPVRADRGADNAVELGVKFRSDVAGSVTGVRFYKHALNTGTHVGNLWSSTGTRLATATFTGESASGWQQVTFSPPVAIAANTVYVASYHCPSGHYSFDKNFFATQGVDRPPLHALASSVASPNGVYAYGATSAFPTETYAATNYWVDVVFSAATQPPPAALTIVTAALPGGTVGSAYSATLAASGGTPPYTWAITSGTLPPGLALNATTGTLSGTPTASGVSSFTVRVSAGAQSASRALTITVDALPQIQTIWPSTAIPVRADRGADNAVELGVKFRSDVAGSVTGVRFYKHALNTGTHVGNLWSSTGTRLATATFTGESASGWQQVTFSPPVAIAANTVYVASYHCPSGHYSFDKNFFATQGVDRPPLHALVSSVASPNGVYAYGATSAFPTETYAATNYWVDVVFSTVAPASLSAASSASSSLAVGSAPGAERLELAGGRRSGAADPEDPCSDEAPAQRGGRHGPSLRRFVLERVDDGYRLTAIGRFAFSEGLDPGTDGMTVVFEDGARRQVAAAHLPGSALAPTPTGWQLRPGTSSFERLRVRRRRGSAVVSLRGTLPSFDVVDAAGAQTSRADGALRWRVAFGPVCGGSLALTCGDDATGRRRCRGESPAARLRSHPDRSTEKSVAW